MSESQAKRTTLGVNEEHSMNSVIVAPWRLPWWLSGKESACSAGVARDTGSIPGSGRFPWRSAWQPTPVFLSGESHGQRIGGLQSHSGGLQSMESQRAGLND